MLFRNFEISTTNSIDLIIENINEITEIDFKFFPKKLLTGSINKDQKLEAVINAPFLMSDPFKNKVSASVG